MTKFCRDCKWASTPHGATWCMHPSNGYNIVSGHVKREYPLEMRNFNGSCGPEGKLWEEYVGFWRRLFKRRDKNVSG